MFMRGSNTIVSWLIIVSRITSQGWQEARLCWHWMCCCSSDRSSFNEADAPTVAASSMSAETDDSASVEKKKISRWPLLDFQSTHITCYLISWWQREVERQDRDETRRDEASAGHRARGKRETQRNCWGISGRSVSGYMGSKRDITRLWNSSQLDTNARQAT
jgi:hypothetical protein